MRNPKHLLRKDMPQRQHGRFIEIARELGADENEAAFKAKLAEIARPKPVAEQQPAPPAHKKRPKK